MNGSDDTDLVLASSSPHRARMLLDAGIGFTVEPPDLDERAVEKPLVESGLDPAGIAEVLARAKAARVSARLPEGYVIGADQLLGLQDAILHKPSDMEEARRRLLQLSGRTHQLHTAVCLVHGENELWSALVTCHITFRRLEPSFIGRYLALVGETALTSVGAYQIEERGVQLIDSMEGDLFSIQGLPMLQLLSALRDHGLIDG